MSEIFEKTKYPTKRSIEWIRKTFNKVKDILTMKGYSAAEAIELAWNLFEDTDWRYYGQGLTIEQRAMKVLTKQEFDTEQCQQMMRAMTEEPDGYGSCHYYITVDSGDRLAVARALVDIGIRSCDIDSGIPAEDRDDAVFFDVQGHYCPEVGRLLSEKLGCLVVVEDAWDNDGSEVFMRGLPACINIDYFADCQYRSTDIPDAFDTEFTVRRNDGSVLGGGGCGRVSLEKIEAYLRPFGFHVREFREEFGYRVRYVAGSLKGVMA